MIFYALTSTGPFQARGFNTSRGAQQMLMYQKSIFDCFYCIKTFSYSKTLDKRPQKVFFSVPVMAQKGMLPANVLKTLSGQRLTAC